MTPKNPKKQLGKYQASTAVMQRRDSPKDDLDYYPTPPWATDALCNLLRDELGVKTRTMSVLDPAAGGGHMAEALRRHFKTVNEADIFDRAGQGLAIRDFLDDSLRHPKVDWIVTNPPFTLGAEFVQAGLRRARRGVAMIQRIAFAEGKRRYDRLFCTDPPTDIAVFVRRVTMLKGRLAKKGDASATCYAWFVWNRGRDFGVEGTRFHWLDVEPEFTE